MVMRPRAIALSWLACGVAVVAVPSALHDLIAALVGGTGAQNALAVSAVSGAVACFLVVLGTPLATFATIAMRRWRIPTYVISAFAAASSFWWLLDPPRRLLMGGYVIIVILASIATLALVGLARAQPALLARTLAGMAGVGVYVADKTLLTPSTYLELHNAAMVVVVAACLSAGADLRRRIEGLADERRARSRLSWLLAGCFGLAVAACLLVDLAAPGWRAAVAQHSVAAHGHLRAARTLADFDRDGYSGLAWGGDCDDLDAARHPRAIDPPGGGDQNCNGLDPPANPSDADRGFTEPFGDASGDYRVVLLVSVDTLRSDVLHPRVMPETWAWSNRGIRFQRMYASSPSTFTSLPLLARASERTPLLADELHALGVQTVRVIAGSGTIAKMDLGFETRLEATTAESVTRAGLAELGRFDRAPGKYFLWLHYGDPHSPYKTPTPVPAPDALPHLPEDYRSAVKYTDEWLGALYRGLSEMSLAEHTLVILTADHGEGFGEFGIYTHGRSAYDVVLRVPGVVVGPGIPASPYPHLSTHRDVVPTVLGAFGARPRERFGRSWLRLRSAPQRPLHDFVFCRTSRYSSGKEVDMPMGVLVNDRYKLVVDIDTQLVTLHDMSRPEQENVDISASNSSIARRLYRALSIYSDVDSFPAFMRAP